MINTEIDWIGEVPEHWKPVKVKYEFSHVKRKSVNYKDEKILSITQRGIVERDISTNEGQIAENYEDYIKVNEGEISMNPMDLVTGWVDINKVSGLMSPAYYTLSNLNKNCETEFVNYIFQSNYRNNVFFRIGKGVSDLEGHGRWTLSRDNLDNFKFFVPPKDEQKKIVNYLDKQTNKINEIIEKLNNKINLLKDYKKSLISNAITGKIEVK